MMRSLITGFIFLLSTYSTDAGCTISINRDLGDPQPLILKPGNYKGINAFYNPDDNGFIHFETEEEILLECPYGKKKKNNNSTRIKCVRGDNFQIIPNGEIKQFYEYSCKKFPFHTARLTNRNCSGTNKEIEIGFVLSDLNFIKLIEICFDPIKQTPIFASSFVSRWIKGYQYSFPRPHFIQDPYFNVKPKKVNNLYSRYLQRVNLNELLGLPENSFKYIAQNGDLYLARGHLVPKADFIFGSQQRATFHYVNAAPQWQNFNGYNWNALEISIRNFASKKKKDLKIYTGIYGIATLPHEETKEEIELYLYIEDEERYGIPVPEIFWKVVYEPLSKAAIAFIGVNNPYKKDIRKICEDVCDDIKWDLYWNRTNISLGYSYCCKVEDLRRYIKNFPEFEVNSTLYV